MDVATVAQQPDEAVRWVKKDQDEIMILTLTISCFLNDPSHLPPPVCTVSTTVISDSVAYAVLMPLS